MGAEREDWYSLLVQNSSNISSVSTKVDQLVVAQREAEHRQAEFNAKVEDRLQHTEVACIQNEAQFDTVADSLDELKTAQKELDTKLDTVVGEINVTFKAAVRDIREHDNDKLKQWITIIALACTVIGFVFGIISV